MYKIGYINFICMDRYYTHVKQCIANLNSWIACIIANCKLYLM